MVLSEEVNGKFDDINGLWLRNQCERYFGNNSIGLLVLDFCLVFFDIFSFDRDNVVI